MGFSLTDGGFLEVTKAVGYSYTRVPAHFNCYLIGTSPLSSELDEVLLEYEYLLTIAPCATGTDCQKHCSLAEELQY